MAARYTACVVGCGSGGRLSLNALAASDRFDLRAAADLRDDAREAIRKEHPGVSVFASAREMFDACPTDVVCVSTYPPSHREIALDALRLPLKGILVEKPLGDTTRAGRDILEAVRGRGLPLAVPHGLLVAPHATRILRHVHDGDIGRLVLMEIECGGWDIINAGIHWLNFFVAALRNEPMASVLAACDTATRTYRDGMQVETEAVTLVQARGGARAVMHTGDDVRTVREDARTLFRILGTEGRIEFPGWKSEYRLWNAAHPAGETVQVPTGPRRPHQVHLENLAAQMDSGRPDYAVAESSLSALELCEAAYLSHRSRCRIDLPLEAFRPSPATGWDPGQPYGGTGGGRDSRKLA
jgi:predicted dehydrogenase